jgi:transposase
MKRTVEEEKRLARRRAELIVQVRSGLLTATEAARQLGVSRKTYYQWEQRALSGMVEALQAKTGGRPCRPRDPQREQMQKRMSELEAQERMREQLEHIRSELKQAESAAQKK